MQTEVSSIKEEELNDNDDNGRISIVHYVSFKFPRGMFGGGANACSNSGSIERFTPDR